MDKTIISALLQLRQCFAEHKGNIMRITLDENANSALRNELSVPAACSSLVLGIVIDQTETCPVCGQDNAL